MSEHCSRTLSSILHGVRILHNSAPPSVPFSLYPYVCVCRVCILNNGLKLLVTSHIVMCSTCRIVPRSLLISLCNSISLSISILVFTFCLRVYLFSGIYLFHLAFGFSSVLVRIIESLHLLVAACNKLLVCSFERLSALRLLHWRSRQDLPASSTAVQQNPTTQILLIYKWQNTWSFNNRRLQISNNLTLQLGGSSG